MTEQRKERGKGEGERETRRSRTGRGPVGDGSAHRVQEATGDVGSACGEVESILPGKNTRLPRCRWGCLQHSLPLFSLTRPNPSLIPTKPRPLPQSHVCQTCPVTPQGWRHPSSPRTADITPPAPAGNLGPQPQGSLRVQAPSLGCLETTDPRKEARQVRKHLSTWSTRKRLL